MKILSTDKAVKNLILSVWLPTEPKEEKQASLSKLILQWANDISPYVSLDRPPSTVKSQQRSTITNIWDPNISALYWGISIEVGKSISFLKSINHLSRDAYSFFYSHDKKATISIAPNKKSSWAISRYSNLSIRISKAENLNAHVENLPIDCLELDANINSLLRELGIHKVKELLKIDIKEINARYGEELSKAIRDLTKGEESILELPEKEKRVLVQKTLLNSIHSQEAFFELLKKSITKACRILQDRHLSSALFTFSLFFDTQDFLALSFPLNLHLDANLTIWKILKPRFESIPYEGCISITTVAKQLKETVEITPELIHLKNKGERRSNSLNILIFLEEVRNVFDDATIKTYRQEFSHLEENSSKLISTTKLKILLGDKEIDNKDLILENNLKTLSRPIGHATEDNAESNIEDRPSILIHDPIKIEIIKIKGNLILKLKTQTFLIKQVLGPEKINTNWWQEGLDPLKSNRSYYKIQLETGLWIWTYKEVKNKCWLLHGIWS